MRMASSGIVGLVVVLVGCDGMEAAMEMPPTSPPTSPPALVRRDPVPAGGTCKYGGAALHTGVDKNRNGVLDDEEITATTYVCDPSTTPLIRRDPIAAGLDCPAGGVAIRAGIDVNGNGMLEDTEIEETTRLCNSLELWEGDFNDTNWSDPVKVAALQGARVVTGSLFILSTDAVRLPLLEIVGGGLLVANRTPSVALPALRHVGGSLELDTPVVDGPLAALERVGGNLVLSSNGAPGASASIAAPQLTEVGGELAISVAARGEVSLPALTSVGSLGEWGQLTVLQLDSLRSIGTDLWFVDPALTSLSLPALRTVGRDLLEAGKLTTLRLDALTRVGGRLIPDDPKLDRFRLPALETIDGDLRVGSIKILELAQLTQLGGRLQLTDELSLTEARLPSLTHVGGDVAISRLQSLTRVDLGSLATVTGTFMVDNDPALTTLHVPALRTVSGVDQISDESIFIWRTGLETIEFGSLASATGCILMTQNSALRTVRLPVLNSARCLAFTDAGDLASPSVLETVSVPNITTLERLIITSNHTLHTADFRQLTAVTVIMELVRTSLPDLTGFSSLSSLQWLTIDGDDRLTDLRGLSSLQQLSFLFIDRNAALTSLDGLERIHEMSGSVELRSNPALTSTAGLRNVTSIGGGLFVQILPALTILDLSSLQTITGRLDLVLLPQVPNLDGLRALTSIGANAFDGLSIADLDSLNTLAGLDALTTVRGPVHVSDVPNVPEDEILAFIHRLRG
jgi:hypothetical protein